MWTRKNQALQSVLWDWRNFRKVGHGNWKEFITKGFFTHNSWRDYNFSVILWIHAWYGRNRSVIETSSFRGWLNIFYCFCLIADFLKCWKLKVVQCSYPYPYPVQRGFWKVFFRISIELAPSIFSCFNSLLVDTMHKFTPDSLCTSKAE